MKKYLLILFLLPFLSLGQELTTSVSRNPVSVGEQFQISFSANGSMEQFRAPNFDGLRILSGPNQSSSSSVQMINGKFSQSKTVSYNYYATPLNEGKLEIGSARAKIDGKEVKSKPVTLEVGKANPKSKNNVIDFSDKVFIKAHINKTKLYQGEQLVVSYKLYTKISLTDLDITSLPELNGFWKEEVETSSRTKVENIKGVNHNVLEISRMILTPQRSGILNIDPMQITVTVKVKNKQQRNHSFGFFSNYQNIQEQLQSVNRNVEVLPLPYPPANFSGAVGKFNLQASLDKTEGKTNEAISYKLTLSGNGNLHLIDDISTEFPTDFEAYDPQLSDKTFISKNGIAGKKVFEHLLVPRYQGVYTIPSVNFVYFNTKSKTYKTIQTESFDIRVNKGKGGATSYQSSEELQERAVSKLIGIVSNTKWESTTNYSWTNSFTYHLLISIPIIGFLFFLILKLIRERETLNPKNVRFKKSLKIANKRLKTAEKHLKNNNKSLFFEEIEKSLWIYFAHKFDADIALLSKETVANYFQQQELSKDRSQQFIKLLEDCAFCRFAPGSLGAKQMDEIYQDATQVIIKVEEEWGK